MRLAVVALALLAAVGCPTNIDEIDAGPEDAGPQSSGFTCRIDITCGQGQLGETTRHSDVEACALTLADAEEQIDPDRVCSTICGSSIVVSCGHACRASASSTICDQ